MYKSNQQPFYIIAFLLQVLQKVGSAEVLGNLLVQTGDDLVNSFLPAGLRIFAGLDSFEELAQCLGYDVNKWSRNLIKKIKLETKLFKQLEMIEG